MVTILFDSIKPVLDSYLIETCVINQNRARVVWKIGPGYFVQLWNSHTLYDKYPDRIEIPKHYQFDLPLAGFEPAIFSTEILMPWLLGHKGCFFSNNNAKVWILFIKVNSHLNQSQSIGELWSAQNALDLFRFFTR